MYSQVTVEGEGELISYITFVRDTGAGGIKSFFVSRHARSLDLARKTCSHSTC